MERSGLAFEHFLWKWSKTAAQKKVFFFWFCLGPPSYGIGATIRIGREMLCLPYAGFLIESFPNSLEEISRKIRAPYSFNPNRTDQANYRGVVLFDDTLFVVVNLNSRAIESHVEPFGAISNHLEPFRAIWSHWNNLEHFGAICTILDGFEAIWSNLKWFWAIWSVSERFGAIWGPVEPLKAILSR